MALPSDKKQTIIQKFATQKGDTGSPEVQIALLTAKVDKLADHLKQHNKDIHSRKGLLAMISKRRRLLQYLLNKDQDRYKQVVQELNLPK
jgi:small subunit ribosomal protein S15